MIYYVIPLILVPYSINATAYYLSATFFEAASLDLINLGLFMNSLMRSIGKADSPTPPNKTNKNHPINAMNPIQNTGNDVGIDTIV